MTGAPYQAESGDYQMERVDPARLAKILGAIYLAIGVIAGIFILIAGLSSGHYMNVIGGIVFPFLYAAVGWIAGYIVAWIYNWVAARTGGVVVTLRPVRRFQ